MIINLQIMNKNTDRLLHLSGQLLDFRKAEMNGFRLNFSREDIAVLLNEHYLNFKAIAEQKNITITISYPKSFYAFVDAEAFNKILSNLWDNALKYATSIVNISMITPVDDSGSYSILFKNDGFLVPFEMREMIFKSFYRAKETAKLPGTGIGLTLSRSLAEIHGGTLTMDFTDKDMNTFILTIATTPSQAH